jgi:hypothetical protein
MHEVILEQDDALQNDIQRLLWVYTLNFKMDETRPLIVHEGETCVKPTRALCAEALHMYILMRKYMGNLSWALRHCYDALKIIIDSGGPEFHRHVETLFKLNPMVSAGDAKEFDTNMIGVIYAVVEEILVMYNDIFYGLADGDEQTLRNLINAMRNALLHYALWLWHMQGCFPTGNALTIDFNSLRTDFMLFCYFCFGRKYIVDNPSKTYSEEVRTWITGDDFMFAVKPGCEGDLQGYANFVKRWFLLIITDPDKSLILKPKIKMTETSILKRTPVKGTHWMGALDWTAIFTQLYFITKTERQEFALCANLQSVQRELFAYGKDAFDYWTNQFVRQMARHNYNFTPLTYVEVVKGYYGRY